VVSLIVFCAVIGMFLAVRAWCRRSFCSPRPSASGLWQARGGGELPGRAEDRRGHDAHSGQAAARGELTSLQTLAFAGAVGGTGLWMLYRPSNPLTMWLTFGTFIGYAVSTRSCSSP